MRLGRVAHGGDLFRQQSKRRMRALLLAISICSLGCDLTIDHGIGTFSN
ncbi:MAG: hypothetical protein AAF961_01725 [Planctomycetota bacterium]